MAKGVPKAIENYEIKLYWILRKELKEGPRRVDYEELARQIGCARSTVTYNVGKLISKGIIGVNHGELYWKAGKKNGKKEKERRENL